TAHSPALIRVAVETGICVRGKPARWTKIPIGGKQYPHQQTTAPSRVWRRRFVNHEEDNTLAPAASPDTPPLPADARLIARSLDALRAVTARCTPAQAAEAFAEEGARLLGAASGYVAVPVDG